MLANVIWPVLISLRLAIHVLQLPHVKLILLSLSEISARAACDPEEGQAAQGHGSRLFPLPLILSILSKTPTPEVLS